LLNYFSFFDLFFTENVAIEPVYKLVVSKKVHETGRRPLVELFQLYAFYRFYQSYIMRYYTFYLFLIKLRILKAAYIESDIIITRLSKTVLPLSFACICSPKDRLSDSHKIWLFGNLTLIHFHLNKIVLLLQLFLFEVDWMLEVDRTRKVAHLKEYYYILLLLYKNASDFLKIVQLLHKQMEISYFSSTPFYNIEKYPEVIKGFKDVYFPNYNEGDTGKRLFAEMEYLSGRKYLLVEIMNSIGRD
jgi:hypothetical protein